MISKFKLPKSMKHTVSLPSFKRVRPCWQLHSRSPLSMSIPSSSSSVTTFSLMTIPRPRGQFHQRSTRSFYVRQLRTQLFCTYGLGLYFTGVSLPAQKLRVERWWNRTQKGQWRTNLSILGILLPNNKENYLVFVPTASLFIVLF